ncbi:MAG: hypothetical protein J0M04_01495 [Verrucomicrobia bacterium]|nr:hypothetical protein [Verrucomicrobiota bacterium]
MSFPTTDISTTIGVGRYRIDPVRRVWLEEYLGKIGLDEMKSMVATVSDDPAWSPEFSGLVDFSQAELSLSSNDVLRLALMMRQEEHRSRGWLAFVVRDSAAYGVVRMLGYWSRSADRVKIFQNREEAEYWLEQRAERPPIRFDEAQVVSREPSLLKVS